MEKQNSPLVLEVKGSSLDDGPGIRTVVFFKGCPLSCVWCHNPESKKRGVELSFDSKRCVGCEECIKVCRYEAISEKNRFFIDRDKCTLCFECVENCPSGALEQSGKTLSIEWLLTEIKKEKPFYNASGGGVTLSGGEPLLHMEFVTELLKQIKAEGIHTLIETSGVFNFQTFEKLILPYTDTVYMDIKLLDPLEHKRYCGISNERILENFHHLVNAAANGLDFLPRIPLIPGITDTKTNLEGIARFLLNHQWEKVQLLEYNPTWIGKLHKIGIPIEGSDLSGIKEFMTEDRIEVCKTFFSSVGIEVL